MEIMTMANASDIAKELRKQWINQYGFESETCDQMLIDTLAQLADDWNDIYVSFCDEENYTVSISYTTAYKDALELFEIERSIGFDLYKLSC